jgi:hypothetical protein
VPGVGEGGVVKFHDYHVLETSESVYATLYIQHESQLIIFSTLTDMDAGRMETVWGFQGASYPLMACRSTWDPSKRDSLRRHEHWLVVAKAAP